MSYISPRIFVKTSCPILNNLRLHHSASRPAAMADSATAGALLERARQYAGELAAQQLAADGDRASLDMDPSNSAAANLDDTLAQLNQLACTHGLDSDAVDASYALALSGKLCTLHHQLAVE